MHVCMYVWRYYYLVFRAVRALRWRHLELPEFVPCVLNRWRHTHPILIIAYMPMLFYVKQLLTNRKIVQTAWMTKSNYIFLRTLARFNPQNWQLDSFLLVCWWWFAVVCGGLRWFVCFSSFSPPIVPNSGGGLRWFLVVCGSLWSFAVVCLIVIPVQSGHPAASCMLGAAWWSAAWATRREKVRPMHGKALSWRPN